jgi:hypothetical protein
MRASAGGQKHIFKNRAEKGEGVLKQHGGTVFV